MRRATLLLSPLGGHGAEPRLTCGLALRRYWLCAATTSCIKIWDLETKSVVDEVRPDFEPQSRKAVPHYCTCLQWSADGSTLYAGYTDNEIRVFTVGRVA